MQIIYLNGASSSGKTTVAKALQQALSKPFLHVSFDRIMGMMPEKLNNWEGGPAPLGFSWKASQDETGVTIQEIQSGPFARKIVDTHKALVLTLVQMGHYVIIDDVAFGKEEVDLWKEALKEYSVLWIAIKAPLEVLEAREQARGNRIQGSARAQYLKVHQNVVYDIEWDSNQDSLDTLISTIKTYLV